LGEPGVEKTALAQRFCFDLFNPSEKLTVGVDFFVKTIELQGKKIKTGASVADRSSLKTPVLIGRNDLKPFLVRVGE